MPGAELLSALGFIYETTPYRYIGLKTDRPMKCERCQDQGILWDRAIWMICPECLGLIGSVSCCEGSERHGQLEVTRKIRRHLTDQASTTYAQIKLAK